MRYDDPAYLAAYQHRYYLTRKLREYRDRIAALADDARGADESTRQKLEAKARIIQAKAVALAAELKNNDFMSNHERSRRNRKQRIYDRRHQLKKKGAQR